MKKIILSYRMEVKPFRKNECKMTHQEKLDLIIQEIIKERPQAIGGVHIIIKITKDNKLINIGRTEILRLLETISSSNPNSIEILQANYPSNELNKTIQSITIDPKTKKEILGKPQKISSKTYSNLIFIHLLPNFDNWYSVYIFEKNQKLEDLDQLQIENILNTVLDIDQQLKIKPATMVTIKINLECRFPILKEKFDSLSHRLEYWKEAVNFLKRKDVITDIKPNYSEYDDNTLNVLLNISEFQEFKIEIENVYEKMSNGDHPDNKIIYIITYNEMTGEIRINDKVIKKTNFDSITDNLFTYLNINPNRKITLNELQEATGKTINNLPKAIENAGFTGNRLRAFFRVSSGVIYFKPQITKTDLEKLNISSLD